MTAFTHAPEVAEIAAKLIRDVTDHKLLGDVMQIRIPGEN